MNIKLLENPTEEQQQEAWNQSVLGAFPQEKGDRTLDELDAALKAMTSVPHKDDDKNQIVLIKFLASFLNQQKEYSLFENEDHRFAASFHSNHNRFKPFEQR